MTVICPKCKAENQLSDDLNRKVVYRCGACQVRFTRISNTDFRKATFWTIVAWFVPAAMIMASRPVSESANAYSSQSYIGNFIGYAGIILPPPVLLATVFFLWQGFRHLNFIKKSPRHFWSFAFVTVLGFGSCFAAVWVTLREWI